MAIKAVLFDIDGTLVDSNYLHVMAWDQAFVDVGHPVDMWRIHRAIGMDSGELLSELLGDAAEEVGDEAKTRHEDHYRELMPRLRSMERAQDLLRELAGRGLRVVLATSAPEEELDVLRKVLKVEDALAALTSSDDVGSAKPSPDIVEVALKRAGVEADEAVFVGDAIWDAKAAANAGVATIGVLTGGFSEAELKDAGAVAVVRDAADLLDHLDESIISR